jgi:outer membrane lipoprotein-sorting protein
MKPAKKIEKLIKRNHYKAKPEVYDKALGNFLQVVDDYKKEKSAFDGPNIWRIIMKGKMIKLAAAAVIAIVVLGGISFWPGGSDAGKWWLGPPKVWAQEILDELNAIKGVTCRERIVHVMSNGSEHVSMTWMKFYVSHDSYRRDIYDDDFLREIQWYVPDGDGMLQHSIRYDLNSYFAKTGYGDFGNYDPVERMRSYVSRLDEADQLLGEEVIDGYNCVGFEISSGMSGDRVDCIWFDKETRLPVRVEHRGMPVTNEPDMTSTIIQDDFDYNPDLSADTFVPQTPEGFIFGHPDDLRKN